MNKLKDKVALITGGSSGIGMATAQLFAQEGAKVIITGRDQEKLDQASKAIHADALAIQSDVSDIEAINDLFVALTNKGITLDILFLNAGDAASNQLGQTSESFFDYYFNLNVKGPFFMVQKSLPLLNNSGSIVFNASAAGILGVENLSVYSATKAAVINFARTMAAELRHRKIRVNALSPGNVDTPLSRRHNAGRYEQVRQNIPLEQRFGTVEELAKAALFLACADSSYITGQNLVVDGGLSALNPIK